MQARAFSILDALSTIPKDFQFKKFTFYDEFKKNFVPLAKLSPLMEYARDHILHAEPQLLTQLVERFLSEQKEKSSAMVVSLMPEEKKELLSKEILAFFKKHFPFFKASQVFEGVDEDELYELVIPQVLAQQARHYLKKQQQQQLKAAPLNKNNLSPDIVIVSPATPSVAKPTGVLQKAAQLGLKLYDAYVSPQVSGTIQPQTLNLSPPKRVR